MLPYMGPIVTNKSFTQPMSQTKIVRCSKPRMKISVSIDISVLGFYRYIGYIGYIGDISMDIFT